MAQMSPAQELENFNINATERSIVLSNKAYGTGSVTFDLPHAGVPVYVTLLFSGKLSVTAGADGGSISASPYWPFNIMAPSSLVDYTGITRIFADGYDLFSLESVKAFADYQKDPYSQESYASAIYTADIPEPTISATVSSDVAFGVVFPISYSKASALGSYAATVPDGESYISVSENALTGATVRSPLTVTSGITAELTGTWSATYYYLDTPSSVPVPIAALQQVHEVYQQQSSSELSAGGSKDVVLQTGRTYYRVLQRLVENNVNNFSDVARIQFLVDSSTPTLDETLAGYMYRIRLLWGRDFSNGTIVRDFTSRPWSPNNYGSLTARLILGNSFEAGSFANLWTLRETLYVPTGNLVAVGG